LKNVYFTPFIGIKNFLKKLKNMLDFFIEWCYTLIIEKRKAWKRK
jgi:hypothetical protein